MSPFEATREIMWNISVGWLMYVLFVPVIVLLVFGCYRRIKLWQQGKPLKRFDSKLSRFWLVLRQIILQTQIARKTIPGIFHRFIVWGFIVFLVATLLVAIQYDFGFQVLQGYFYLVFQSLIVDLFGALVLIGLLIAAIRRWIIKPVNLVYNQEANIILVVLMGIIFSGFLLEGWRIAATNDPWAVWSPVGYLLAELSASLLSAETIRVSHKITWWIHLLLVFGFIASIPYTRMLHIFTSPLNIFTANLNPIGANLKHLDVDPEDESTVLGVDSINSFTWKDLLDLDACTGCGRCTDNCPANISGKTLSPRNIILDLRTLLNDWNEDRQNETTNDEPQTNSLFKTISPDNLWECTTCAACVEACPVSVEQMPKIIDMRRFLVMEKAEFPETIQDAVMSLEERGHPIKGTRATRIDWMKGLEVPLIKDRPDAEILLWVGSPGALVERSQQVTQAFVKLLLHAGIKFAVLGREEKSTGDLARRVGNEFLFQMQVQENIEVLEKYKVKKIVTTCPHTFNTFRNEYPAFGGNYTVFHHSEYLMWLIETGQLSVSNKLDLIVTYHDPCYLSRHNNIVNTPRTLMKQICKNKVIEMTRNKRDSFCCGGGGGMSYAEEIPSQRVNRFRANQVIETQANVVAVACPYCMTMLEDGIKAEKGNRQVQVLDIAELVGKVVE
jgi:Fe-S oxidoreductase/nitrate reductase gamma subunit